MSEIRVLAAFVNHDGASMTLAALASLLDSPGKANVLAVVVDSGSSPADLAVLEDGLRGRATLVRLEQNRGYAAACNAASGIAMSDGIPYVWWLNNDVVIEPGALDALVEHLDASPRVAAATAVTVDEETGSEVLSAGMDLVMWRSSVRSRHVGARVDELPGRPYSVDVIPATCVLVRVAAMAVVGGMDEGYFMYGEDVDWCVRARAAGYVLDVVPSAHVRHGRGRSSTKADRLRLIMRNRVRFMRARAGPALQVAFLGYFVLAWLPAYTAARLVPRFGLRAGLRLARDPLAWNLRDARRRRRWRLRPEDQEIPFP